MDLHYFQGVGTLEELEKMYHDEALYFNLDNDRKSYKKLNREYVYLKKILDVKEKSDY